MPATWFSIGVSEAEVARWNTLETGPTGSAILRQPLRHCPHCRSRGGSVAAAEEFVRWWVPLRIDGALCVE
jgi:hypothetical protein